MTYGSRYRRMIVRTLQRYVIDGMINEANFHVCGNDWQHLNYLLDHVAYSYGTIDAWVVAVAAEWVEFDDDSYESLKDSLTRTAQQLLGLTDSQWERVEGLPHGRAVDQLAILVGISREDRPLAEAS